MASTQNCTVIIRTKNSGNILAQTLKALYSQEKMIFDLLAIDSGSTDATLKILESYNCNVISIKPEEYFPGKVLNKAFALVQTEFVILLNSDAVLLTPDSLFHLLQAMNDPNIAAVFGRQLPWPDTETWVRRDYQASFPPTQVPPKWINLSFPLAIVRKSAWEKRHFYENAWGSEDNEWGYWAKNAGSKISYVPEAMVMHSHNYTLRQLYGRRFIEGEADAYIYKKKYTFKSMLWQWCKATLRDIKFYIQVGDWLGMLKIPILRFVYFWAYLQGHQLGQNRQRHNDPDASKGQNAILSRQ